MKARLIRDGMAWPLVIKKLVGGLMIDDCIRRDESSVAMVSSGKPEATEIGLEILRQGGNAIDAAVAVGFAMGVAEPATSGLGGGGFMTVKTPDMHTPLFIDFREYAPENATSDMWEFGEDGKVLNKENAIGPKSVSVPGEVAGLLHALNKYGTLTPEQVMKPSISLAKEGIVVSSMLEKMLKQYEKYLINCEDATRIYLNNKKGFKQGDLLKNPDLASTLERIATNGPTEFYQGQTGRAILDKLEEAGGLITKKDMCDYTVEEKEPVIGSYRGYTIISSPPPSSGGTHIIQALNILESFDVGAMEVNSVEYLHLFSEALKLSYEDRARFMADTNFIDVPLKGLRSKKYSEKLVDKINMDLARVPSCYDPWTYEHDDTTHYSIADEAGNMVSVTKTINHFFGACMVAKDSGVLLNDTMADFSTKKYDVNAVERRKKPLSTMSPTIILKEGKPFAVIGSPGGVRIISVVVQMISKLIDHQMDIQEAIESPRITQDASNRLLFESRIHPNVVKRLDEMGHEMVQCSAYDKKMGGVNALMYTPTGKLVGGADPRRDGIAKGL